MEAVSKEMIREIIVGETPLDELISKWGISLRVIRRVKRGHYAHLLHSLPGKRVRYPAVKVFIQEQPVPQKEKLLGINRR